MSYKYRSETLPQGALIEFVRVGAYIKVMAVDPVSYEEVSIVGDPKTPGSTLAREAVKKLEYVLARRRAGNRTLGTQKPMDPAEAVVRRGRRTDTPSGWEM